MLERQPEGRVYLRRQDRCRLVRRLQAIILHRPDTRRPPVIQRPPATYRLLPEPPE